MRPLLLAGAAGVASLILYVATLAPDVVGGDAGEFQFVPYVLGIPHHTGYPLYTLLGKAWSLVPIGSVAWRMNLLSAVFAAAAVAAVYLAAWEMTGRLSAAVVAAASLAVSGLFWQWATIAGVRSSTALMVALVIYLAVRWSSETRVKRFGATARTFALLSLTYGAALAHHRSAVLLAPPLLLFILVVNARIVFSAGVMARSALLIAFPLLTYLYLPIRSAMGTPFDQFHPDTLPRFLDLVLATRLSQSFLSVPMEAMPARATMLGVEFWREFGGVGAGLAMLGVGWLLWRKPPVLALTALFALAVAAQTLNWNVGQDHLNVVYLIPAYVVVALWIGAGVGSLGGTLLRALRFAPLAKAVLTAVVVMLLVPFVQSGVANWDEMQRYAERPLDKFRQHIDAGYVARRLVMASLPYVEDNAAIFADWEQATPFWYVQHVEGLKTGVEVLYGVGSVDEMEKRVGERPIYVARAIADTGQRRFTAVGPLAKLMRGSRRELSRAPAGMRPLDLVFGAQIKLLGYVQYDDRGRIVEDAAPQASVLPFTLYWQALERPREDYSVSTRLMDSAGNLVAQLDNRHPVLSMSPTRLWEPDEVVGDYYELPLAGLSPGNYRLEVLLYTSSAQGWRNLEVVDASGRALGERAAVTEVVR